MKLYPYLFLAFLGISCTKLDKGEGSDDLLVLNTSMRKSIKKKETAEEERKEFHNKLSLEALPSEWILLTQRKDQLVVYYPCDADNQTISINMMDGEYFLLHGLGQDANMYKVEGFEQTGEYGFKLHLKTVNKNERIEAEAVYTDPEQKVIAWKGLLNSTERMFFTSIQNVESYVNIVQPCTDCWSEEECNQRR